MTQKVKHVRSTVFDEEEREREEENARYLRLESPCILIAELMRMHDGKLDEARTAAIEQHLASCSWCSANYRGALQGREEARKESERPVALFGPPPPGSALEALVALLDAFEAEKKPPA